MSEPWVAAGSLALTVTLALLTLYFFYRVAVVRTESPGVWGAITAAGSIAALSGFQTVSLLVADFMVSGLAQGLLRWVAVAGVVHFWIFYRRSRYVDVKGRTST